MQEKILEWYSKNKRDLPWRRTKDPYAILVSEVMLQQTQVDRVISKYLAWMEAFPTLNALATADKRKVLLLWSGLGYNNRALRLQKLAQTLKDGELPKTEEELLKLPGIGPYTARAILAFAFNKEVAVIDTNIRRVLIHELGLSEDISLKELEKIALDLVPKGKSCIWHNALMDYGAMEKTARKTGVKSLSKQSKFEGSERQVRGRILKKLLSEKKVSIEELREMFFHENFDVILEGMRKEGILRVEKNEAFL